MKINLSILWVFFAILLPLRLFAGHPEPGQMGTVKALAHQLQQKADHVHEQAEGVVDPYNYQHQQALSDLHKLARKAAHFHKLVEQSFQDPSHTEHDFHELADALRQSQHSFGAVGHHWHHLEHDFQEVVGVFQRLRSYYVDDHHGHSPIRITRIRRGGSWNTTTVRIYGEIDGHDIVRAGVYVNGRLYRSIANHGSFYVRVKFRGSSRYNSIEVRAEDHWGRVYRERITRNHH